MSYNPRIEELDRRCKSIETKAVELKVLSYTVTANVSVAAGVSSTSVSVPKASIPADFNKDNVLDINVQYGTANGIGFIVTSFAVNASGNLVVQVTTANKNDSSSSIKPTIKVLYTVAI